MEKNNSQNRFYSLFGFWSQCRQHVGVHRTCDRMRGLRAFAHAVITGRHIRMGTREKDFASFSFLSFVIFIFEFRISYACTRWVDLDAYTSKLYRPPLSSLANLFSFNSTYANSVLLFVFGATLPIWFLVWSIQRMEIMYIYFCL